MSEVKKVLVVDDHFEMLDFLRSMLELSSKNYDVLAVPSAEEGLLELRQDDFDLLITDVRLAGMSGFDLVRRMQTFKPSIPVIMITAYSSAQGEREAAELGVQRYFRKPLDTDEVLAEVHTALYGGLVVHADQPVDADESAPIMPDEVTRRLEILRTDTGATKLSLATISGKPLLQVGQGTVPNLPELTTLLAGNLEKSFLLAEQLGGDSPATIQYHSGSDLELYIANVGKNYFLTIFYDVQARRGRMGTIWVFAQRAIKDLLTVLPPLEESEPAAMPEEETKPVVTLDPTILPQQPGLPPGATDSSELRSSPKHPVSEVTEEEAGKSRENAPGEPPELLAPAETDGYVTWDTGELKSDHVADDYWEQGLAGSMPMEGESGTITFEEAQQQGFVPDESDSESDTVMETTEEGSETTGESPGFLGFGDSELANPVALDDFWETAANEESLAIRDGDGFTLEEAMRQGLVPEAFQEIDDPESNDRGSAEESGESEEKTDATNPREKPLAKSEPSTETKKLKPLHEINADAPEDLDTFWNTAADSAEVVNDDLTNGFSYEEAVRRGLIKTEGESDETTD